MYRLCPRVLKHVIFSNKISNIPFCSLSIALLLSLDHRSTANRKRRPPDAAPVGADCCAVADFERVPTVKCSATKCRRNRTRWRRSSAVSASSGPGPRRNRSQRRRNRRSSRGNATDFRLMGVSRYSFHFWFHSFNCLSCCIMCCPNKGDGSRRTSNFSKKQSIAPTIPPEVSLESFTTLVINSVQCVPILGPTTKNRHDSGGALLNDARCYSDSADLFGLLLFGKNVRAPRLQDSDELKFPILQILNVVIPGLGTILSGGLCLCIGKPRFSQHDSIKGRIGSFIINCIVGVSQCFTIIFCVVGWGWAIWWGTIMIRLASEYPSAINQHMYT